MNVRTEYQEAEFYKIVSDSKLHINSTCPLVEDEAIIWAANKIAELEKDKAKLDWLADTEQYISNIQPDVDSIQCKRDALRHALNDAMEL